MKISAQFPQMLRVPFLDDLAPDFRAALIDKCVAHTYPPKTAVLEQGKTAGGMFIMSHGQVEISHRGPNGEVVIIANAGVGDTFGELEALSGEVCLASCITLTSATILELPVAVLAEAMMTPAFMRNVMKLTYSRLERDNRDKHLTTYRTVEQRLCVLLDQLSDKNGDVRRSQGYLADMIGCSRQTINKELATLRDAGLLVVDKRTIRIQNIDGLRKRSAVELDLVQ